MKHRFKDKCDVCGTWSNSYEVYKSKMIVCDKCMAKHNGRFELKEVEQLSIFDIPCEEKKTGGDG